MSRFKGTWGPWPTEGGVARKGVVEGEGIRLELDSEGLRDLAGAALDALGFTTVPRTTRQWWTTWEADVAERVSPILAVVDALLAAPARKVVRRVG